MAEKTRRRVFRTFFAWQDDREEAWLREMAKKGWHLERPGIFRQTFVAGAPTDVVYRFDYRIVNPREQAEYLGLFRDSGWEYLGSVSNWHYFRTPAGTGADPDIFSDDESRAAKYRRLLAMLLLFPPLLVSQMTFIRRLQRPALISFLMAAITLFLGYAVLRIGLRIRQLKRKG